MVIRQTAHLIGSGTAAGADSTEDMDPLRDGAVRRRGAYFSVDRGLGMLQQHPKPV